MVSSFSRFWFLSSGIGTTKHRQNRIVRVVLRFFACRRVILLRRLCETPTGRTRQRGFFVIFARWTLRSSSCFRVVFDVCTISDPDDINVDRWLLWSVSSVYVCIYSLYPFDRGPRRTFVSFRVQNPEECDLLKASRTTDERSNAINSLLLNYQNRISIDFQHHRSA